MKIRAKDLRINDVIYYIEFNNNLPVVKEVKINSVSIGDDGYYTLLTHGTLFPIRVSSQADHKYDFFFNKEDCLERALAFCDEIREGLNNTYKTLKLCRSELVKKEEKMTKEQFKQKVQSNISLRNKELLSAPIIIGVIDICYATYKILKEEICANNSKRR